uniref:Uncharacterized protein n=1 Tax=Oryza rufipogon TaxID=4529 RepID=A0A0E0RKB6_ORYRU
MDSSKKMVGHLGEQYQEWVHQPIVSKEGPRLFANDVLEKYHLNHHFRIQNKGFGITSTLWDHVFGTLPSTKTIDKKSS